MSEAELYNVVSDLVLYLITGMCFISYIWMRRSMKRLSKGHIYNLFDYILWIVKWGFLCSICLFLLKIWIVERGCSYLIDYFAIFISLLFMIVSYIAIKMKEISKVFGFK